MGKQDGAINLLILTVKTNLSLDGRDENPTKRAV